MIEIFNYLKKSGQGQKIQAQIQINFKIYLDLMTLIKAASYF
ncbi:hypothetical protein J504_2433 [Acinetobacter baumannii 348935]|nr:hypothetical protein J504_2433 [Acinetobacter baumannii 348935]